LEEEEESERDKKRKKRSRRRRGGEGGERERGEDVLNARGGKELKAIERTDLSECLRSDRRLR